MFRFVLILFFVFLQFAQVWAQTLWTETRDGQWLMKYNPGGKAYKADNQIINQLALAHKKITERTSFVFHYSYTSEISYNTEGQLLASIRLTPGICTGDVTMHGFDLSEILIPGKSKISVSMLSPGGEVLYESEPIDFVLSDLVKGIYFPAISDTLWKRGNRLETQFHSFSFTSETYAFAESELNALLNYQAAVSLADTLEKRLKAARIARLTPGNAFGILAFSNKAIRLLEEAVAVRTLLLPGADPGNLKQKFEINKFRYSELKQHLLKPGSLLANKGQSFLVVSDAYRDMMLEVLNISRNTDHQSSPFYYRLFSNCLSQAQISEMDRMLKNYAGTMHYGSKYLSLRILQRIEQLSDTLMNEGRFAEAVDLLTSGEKFASANPAVFIPGSLSERLRKARSGLTSSYTRIVQKALAGKLPDLAQRYLIEAESYAQRFDIAELESSGLISLYEEMAAQHMSKGNQLFQAGEFLNALTEFEKASFISQTKPGVKPPAGLRNATEKAFQSHTNFIFTGAKSYLKTSDILNAEIKLNEALTFSANYTDFKYDLTLADSLKNGIAQIKFNRLIAESWKANSAHSKEEAFTRLFEAAKVFRNYSIHENPQYDTLIAKVGITKINNLYSEGRLKIWAGEPAKAMELALIADELVDLFGLNYNPDIKKQHLELEKLAEETLCGKIKGELESLVNQANDLFSRNHFTQAGEVISEARELVFSYSFCGITTKEINQVLSRHQQAIRWNQMNTEALNLLTSGDFLNGSSRLQETEALYHYYRLDTLGLLNTGLLELSMNTNDTALLLFATHYYITRNKADESLQLTEKLRISGLPAQDVNDIQGSLARIVAKRDKTEYQHTEIKTMLKVYTGGNKWYKRFADAYTFHMENQ